MMGIEREIDRLGRVVIPIEFRKKLGIEFNSKVLISLSNGEITITAQKNHCALCGKEINVDYNELKLCGKCIDKIKAI